MKAGLPNHSAVRGIGTSTGHGAPVFTAALFPLAGLRAPPPGPSTDLDKENAEGSCLYT